MTRQHGCEVRSPSDFKVEIQGAPQIIAVASLPEGSPLRVWAGECQAHYDAGYDVVRGGGWAKDGVACACAVCQREADELRRLIAEANA